METEDHEDLELVIELCDNHLHYEEWTYLIQIEDLAKWDAIDSVDEEEGYRMVRILLAMGLGDNSPITWELLQKNVVMLQFLTWGVPEYIEHEVPRLSLINSAVDKMHCALVNLAIEKGIRKVH